MPRPTIGVEKKTRINLRIDPTVWKTFQTLAAAKLPPKTSASGHVAQSDITLVELCADIKANGIRQRLKVRPSARLPGKYEIIDGNRRKRCAELLRWGKVPCRIREMTDQQAYETAFIVNSSRQNLEPFEQGRWFTIMMETFPETYPNQRELADHVGLNQSTVSRHIAYYEAQTKPVAHHDANGITEKQNEKNGLKEKSGIKQPDSEKTSFQKSAENAPSAENSLKQPDTTLHSIIVNEYVDRAIRASPPEIQEQLRREAEEKQFTVKQTQERANELAVEYYISLIPKSFLNRVRSIAERERKWGQDPLPLVKDIEMDFNLSLEDGIKLLQAETAKRVKKERAKKRALVKSLSQTYPESRRLLQIIIDNFGRQKPDVMARMVFTLADQAIDFLSEEQLKQIIENIKVAAASIR